MNEIDRMRIYEKKNFRKYFDSGLVQYEEPNAFYYRQNFEIRMGIPEDKNHSYKYNSHGYRGDDFINLGEPHDGKHVLFAGCSETEGVGTRLEDLWAYKVYQRITETEKCSGFFNIGSKGFSIDLIVEQIFSYIEQFGKPEVLFVNFPDLFKFYVWDEKQQRWMAKIGIESAAAYNIYDKFYLKDFKSGIYKEESNLMKDIMNKDLAQFSGTVNGAYFVPELMSEDKYANSVFNGIRYFHLVEKLCRILGIELFWGTWDMYCSTSVENSGLFNNYTNIGNIKSLYAWADENGYTVDDLSARDKGHCGKAYHAYWADRLFAAYKEKLGNK